MSKDEAKLVFKDIYRLYNGDRIFCKINSRRYKVITEVGLIFMKISIFWLPALTYLSSEDLLNRCIWCDSA